MRYEQPTCLAGALRLLGEEPGARAIAGGTDVMIQVHRSGRWPALLVSLRRVPELAGIEVGAAGARIGAATTVAELAAHPELAAAYPALVAAARVLGSVQIRNAATIGGNLINCSPCADLAPPLLVCEASVELAAPGGRRTLPIEQLFVGPGVTSLRPGELLAAVQLPPPAAGLRAGFVKQGRVAMDLALASVAAAIELHGDGRCAGVRIAAGAVAPVPLRLRGVEDALAGQVVDAATIERARARAGAEVAPISDLRASAEHRRALTGALLARLLRRLAAPEVRP